MPQVSKSEEQESRTILFSASYARVVKTSLHSFILSYINLIHTSSKGLVFGVGSWGILQGRHAGSGIQDGLELTHPS